MGYRIIHILLSPIIISFVLVVLIIYFSPDIFKKFSLKVIKKEVVINNVMLAYCDLDNDGYSEKIEVGSSIKNLTQLRVYTEEQIINQWNFPGTILIGSNPFYGDINGDKIKEIILLSHINGQILLNAINPITSDTLITNKFIADYHSVTSETDCGVEPCGFYDTNKDGLNEIYFALSTSYSISPRKMFSYDPAADSVYYSQNGCNVIEQPIAWDLDGDGKKEFMGNSGAVGNCKPESNYSDYFSWLMVFDEKMNFKLDPLIVGYFPSRFFMKPLTIRNKHYLLLLNLYEGDQNYPSFIAIYDEKGSKIKEKIITNAPEFMGSHLFQYSNDFKNIFIVKRTGEVFKIEPNLELSSIDREFNSDFNGTYAIDIDRDNVDEIFLFNSGLSRNLIVRNDFSHPVFFDFRGNNRIHYPDVILHGEDKQLLFFEGDKYRYYVDYHKNILFFLKYVIYISIWGMIYSMILGIQKTQKYRAEQKYENEKHLVRLQLQSIKNQVDPHFALNIMNSIGSLYLKEDKEKADYVFGKYSKLLRNTLLSSEDITTTLRDELDYVKTFLDLEKFRLNNNFEYEIAVGTNVDELVKIPRMLLHTFVENAIKHGIRHLEGKGLVEIIISKENEFIVISIVDNGIGIENTKLKDRQSTGKGLEIIDSIIDLYYKLEKKKIRYVIADGSNKSGTEVKIWLAYY